MIDKRNKLANSDDSAMTTVFNFFFRSHDINSSGIIEHFTIFYNKICRAVFPFTFLEIHFNKTKFSLKSSILGVFSSKEKNPLIKNAEND